MYHLSCAMGGELCRSVVVSRNISSFHVLASRPFISFPCFINASQLDQPLAFDILSVSPGSYIEAMALSSGRRPRWIF